MAKLKELEIKEYVEKQIPEFHQARLDRLQDLKLDKILKRKNPYLFRAKNLITAPDLVKGLLDAHLSSQEEAVFGTFLEGLAIFVCRKTYNGWKSSAEGVDLEFDHEGTRYLVTIKSGPNWGNSGQIAGMKENFRKAKRILRTTNSRLNIAAVNGCCYGQDEHPDKGDYLKYCGQRFWHFISGDERMYVNIIKPLGHQAKLRNEEFAEEYAKRLINFARAFIDRFCDIVGQIQWEKLLKFNSGTKE